MKTITVYRGNDNEIEGIKVSSWAEQNINRPSGAQTTDFFQKTRSFGKTDKNENICAECVMNLDKDESITVLSYRKSKVWIKNYLPFFTYVYTFHMWDDKNHLYVPWYKMGPVVYRLYWLFFIPDQSRRGCYLWTHFVHVQRNI